MAAHRIVAVENTKARHSVVAAVHTVGDVPVDDRRWTVRAVLDAMNRADRFYSEAPNGRQARVQRYRCAHCGAEHIRTHISDNAIHQLGNLPPGPLAAAH